MIEYYRAWITQEGTKTKKNLHQCWGWGGGGGCWVTQVSNPTNFCLYHCHLWITGRGLRARTHTGTHNGWINIVGNITAIFKKAFLSTISLLYLLLYKLRIKSYLILSGLWNKENSILKMTGYCSIDSYVGTYKVKFFDLCLAFWRYWGRDGHRIATKSASVDGSWLNKWCLFPCCSN